MYEQSRIARATRIEREIADIKMNFSVHCPCTDRSIHHNNFKPLRLFRRALSREVALGTGSLVGAEAVHLPREESPILLRDPWCGRNRVHGPLLIGFAGGEFLRLVACYSF